MLAPIPWLLQVDCSAHAKIPPHLICTNSRNILHRSWSTLNPTFEVHFFDDSNLTSFLRLHRPEFSEHMATMSMVEKADVFRYAALFNYGGVYTDVDVECIRPIHMWLDDFKPGARARKLDFIIGVEFDDVQAHANNPLQLVQWTMASSPRNPMFEYVLEFCLESLNSISRADDTSTLHRTGPVMFTKAILKFIGRYIQGAPRGHDPRFYNYPVGMLPIPTLEENGQHIRLKKHSSWYKHGVILPYRAFGCHPQHRGKSKMNQHHQVEHRFAGSWRGQPSP